MEEYTPTTRQEAIAKLTELCIELKLDYRITHDEFIAKLQEPTVEPAEVVAKINVPYGDTEYAGKTDEA